MSKLLLVSVVVAQIAAPLIAAKDASPARGLRKALLFTLVADVLYVLALRFIYPHL